jgi:hypothetical protein
MILSHGKLETIEEGLLVLWHFQLVFLPPADDGKEVDLRNVPAIIANAAP